MTWNSTLPDRTAPMKRSAMKRHGKRPRGRNVKRHTAEWLRAYHSVERVTWVKQQPCILAGRHVCAGAIENAHTKTGGMGRKGDFTTIVPACAELHRTLMHGKGVAFVARTFKLDLTVEAARVQSEWEAIGG